MPQTTPRRVGKSARTAALVTGPASPAIMALWGVGIWPHDRPHLAMMAFTLALMVTGVATVVWALAVCHLAIAQAFAVGVQIGRHQPAAPPAHRATTLRAVD